MADSADRFCNEMGFDANRAAACRICKFITNNSGVTPVRIPPKTLLHCVRPAIALSTSRSCDRLRTFVLLALDGGEAQSLPTEIKDRQLNLVHVPSEPSKKKKPISKPPGASSRK